MRPDKSNRQQDHQQDKVELSGNELVNVTGGHYYSNGGTVYGCAYCSELFMDKAEAEQHIREVHPGNSVRFNLH